MINNDRIVPVTKTDLISLYAVILKAHMVYGNNLTKISSSDVEGNFVVDGTGTYIADQPVKTVTYSGDNEGSGLFFVAANDFAGFLRDGEPMEYTGEVVADGSTLYQAFIANSALTVSKFAF